MTLINHRWRDRDIRSFDKHLKKYQGVNEILLAYDLVSEPMRVYLTDVGLVPLANPKEAISQVK